MLGRFCERIHALSFRTKLAAVSSVAVVTAAVTGEGRPQLTTPEREAKRMVESPFGSVTDLPS